MRSGDAAPVDILVVCTSNRCRSPLAAALLEASLTARDINARLETAGRRGAGHRATRETVSVAERRGLDLSSHRSRVIDADLIARADLILGMERTHVRTVVELDASAWPRAFTLKELVRRGEASGRRAPDESLQDWLRRVGEGRVALDVFGDSPDDDVHDPTGGPIAEHEDLASELEDLAARLADLIAVPLPPVRWHSP